jgi:hypothetical protein
MNAISALGWFGSGRGVGCGVKETFMVRWQLWLWCDVVLDWKLTVAGSDLSGNSMVADSWLFKPGVVKTRSAPYFAFQKVCRFSGLEAREEKGRKVCFQMLS